MRAREAVGRVTDNDILCMCVRVGARARVDQIISRYGQLD